MSLYCSFRFDYRKKGEEPVYKSDVIQTRPAAPQGASSCALGAAAAGAWPPLNGARVPHGSSSRVLVSPRGTRAARQGPNQAPPAHPQLGTGTWGGPRGAPWAGAASAG